MASSLRSIAVLRTSEHPFLSPTGGSIPILGWMKDGCQAINQHAASCVSTSRCGRNVSRALGDISADYTRSGLKCHSDPALRGPTRSGFTPLPLHPALCPGVFMRLAHLFLPAGSSPAPGTVPLLALGSPVEHTHWNCPWRGQRGHLPCPLPHLPKLSLSFPIPPVCVCFLRDPH